MIQRPALSVGKRDAVCVGGVAVLTDDVEYALDKSPYLHGNSADAACAYGQKQLKQTALVEAEVEVVYAEGAEEYSQQAGGNFGLSVGSGRRGLCRLLSRLSRLTGSLGSIRAGRCAAGRSESGALRDLGTAVFTEHDNFLLVRRDILCHASL